jgi:hypothetical protein
MDPYAPVYPQSDLVVSRALAVVAARRRDYDGELAGRVG